jgi:cell division protein FtsX
LVCIDTGWYNGAMPEPIQPPPDPAWPAPVPATYPSVPYRPAPRRRWGLLVTVAAAALLAGAVIVTTVIVVAGRYGGPPKHRFDVAVFLKNDSTAEQQETIRSALPALHPVDGIRFEDRQQAYQRFKEQFKDAPDLIATIRPDELPESFRLTTSGTEFDCAAAAPVRQLPGVDDILVLQVPDKGTSTPMKASPRVKCS